MPGAAVVDASVVVRWLVGGPFEEACNAFLDWCVAHDTRLLAPTCLYSEVANALYRLCLSAPPRPILAPDDVAVVDEPACIGYAKTQDRGDFGNREK